jgi:orotidine-5'-phosphate decarboxylase
MNFDSITISPYMGEDSVSEFLKYDNKYVILLALTSNNGAKDFQLPNSHFLDIITKSKKWDNSKNLMYVVGATKTSYYKKIRNIIPNNFLLIPGVGSQGGKIKDVINSSTLTSNNIIINVSRAIIYSSSKLDYLDKAEEIVDLYNKQMGL